MMCSMARLLFIRNHVFDTHPTEPDQSDVLEDDAKPKKKRKTAKAEGGEASQGPSQSKIDQRKKGKISLKVRTVLFKLTIV